MTAASRVEVAGAEYRKAITAGVIGNVLEWYDFGVYGYLVPTISALFFPGGDPVVSLLSTFAVFGVGFVMRPVGSIVFGIYGDRHGRRKALSAVIFVMAVATFAMGPGCVETARDLRCAVGFRVERCCFRILKLGGFGGWRCIGSSMAKIGCNRRCYRTAWRITSMGRTRFEIFIEELDLAALGFSGVTPAATGRPAYHPSTLLKIYLYGYLNRVQSSRRLEREAQRNIELMWLTGRLAPDFKTIADFRKDNGSAIQSVCRQFVELCRRLKLFTGAVVAIDGSKFKAVNNRDKNYTVAKVTGRM